MGRTARSACLAGALMLCAGPSARAECPPAPELMERVRRVDLSLGSRTARFSVPPPLPLYEKAARKTGRPYAAHKGARGFGVIVAPVPVERLWIALNDEEHHALDGYIPVRHSEVIEGTPGGASRVLFQYFQRMGIGRWWVSRVWMNQELFKKTEGKLWEILWEDRMQEVDPARPPMNTVSSRMSPIHSSRGAWLLVPVGPSCTVIEHFSWSEPGGMAGALQGLVLNGALRDTARGLVRLAEEHLTKPHPGATFRRPDGKPLPLAAGQ